MQQGVTFVEVCFFANILIWYHTRTHTHTHTHIKTHSTLQKVSWYENKWCPPFKTTPYFTSPSLFMGKIWTSLFFREFWKLKPQGGVPIMLMSTKFFKNDYLQKFISAKFKDWRTTKVYVCEIITRFSNFTFSNYVFNCNYYYISRCIINTNDVD